MNSEIAPGLGRPHGMPGTSVIPRLRLQDKHLSSSVTFQAPSESIFLSSEKAQILSYWRGLKLMLWKIFIFRGNIFVYFSIQIQIDDL